MKTAAAVSVTSSERTFLIVLLHYQTESATARAAAAAAAATNSLLTILHSPPFSPGIVCWNRCDVNRRRMPTSDWLRIATQ